MSHQIVIDWPASADAGAGYNVYRGQTAGGEDYSAPLNGTTPLAPGTLSYTDTSVVPGKWFYTVKAVENGVEAAPSPELAVSLPPAAVTALSLVSVS